MSTIGDRSRDGAGKTSGDGAGFGVT